MELTAMCFCLLPVTGSNLNLFLLREVVKKRILENLCDFVDFLYPKLVKLKMASGLSPPGQPGFKIRPLRPDDEIPSGRRDTWLSRHDRKQHLHNFKHKTK